MALKIFSLKYFEQCSCHGQKKWAAELASKFWKAFNEIDVAALNEKSDATETMPMIQALIHKQPRSYVRCIWTRPRKC